MKLPTDLLHACSTSAQGTTSEARRGVDTTPFDPSREAGSTWHAFGVNTRSMRRVLFLGLFLAGCQSTWGTLLVRIELESDRQTQCVEVTAGTGRAPLAVGRGDKDVLLVAIQESESLTGDVTISVQRFADPDCSRPLGELVRQVGRLSKSHRGSLTFTFRDAPPDSGAPADAGAAPDGGCDLSRCGPVPPCATAPSPCVPDGGCSFPPAPAGTPCDAGLCDGRGTCRPPCAVLEEGASCDDGLTCTVDHCTAGACVGLCIDAPPQCQRLVPACAADAGACDHVALPNDTTCALPELDGGRARCRDGRCERTLPFPPANLDDSVSAFPLPLGAWEVTPGCTVVIDTSTSPPSSLDGGWCAAERPAIAVTHLAADGGEAAILSMSSLTLGAGAAVHVVGTRPVVLVVLDDATIDGLLSVAPWEGHAPAGSGPPECTQAHAEVDAARGWGGGGGAYGAQAGTGGAPDGGTPGGGAWGMTGLLEPLRGGCPGGTSADGGSGGLGGGALQLSVGGHLLVADGGILSASGGGGQGGPLFSFSPRGGGGGGSGGAILLEASVLTQVGFVTANGGGGGEGSDGALAGANGTNGALDASSAAPGGASVLPAGGAGGIGGARLSKGGGAGSRSLLLLSGGGGGGSVGRIRLRAHQATLDDTRLSGQLRIETD